MSTAHQPTEYYPSHLHHPHHHRSYGVTYYACGPSGPSSGMYHHHPSAPGTSVMWPPSCEEARREGDGGGMMMNGPLSTQHHLLHPSDPNRDGHFFYRSSGGCVGGEVLRECTSSGSSCETTSMGGGGGMELLAYSSSGSPEADDGCCYSPDGSRRTSSANTLRADAREFVPFRPPSFEGEVEESPYISVDLSSSGVGGAVQSEHPQPSHSLPPTSNSVKMYGCHSSTSPLAPVVDSLSPPTTTMWNCVPAEESPGGAITASSVSSLLPSEAETAFQGSEGRGYAPTLSAISGTGDFPKGCEEVGGRMSVVSRNGGNVYVYTSGGVELTPPPYDLHVHSMSSSLDEDPSSSSSGHPPCVPSSSSSVSAEYMSMESFNRHIQRQETSYECDPCGGSRVAYTPSDGCPYYSPTNFGMREGSGVRTSLQACGADEQYPLNPSLSGTTLSASSSSPISSPSSPPSAVYSTNVVVPLIEPPQNVGSFASEQQQGPFPFSRHHQNNSTTNNRHAAPSTSHHHRSSSTFASLANPPISSSHNPSASPCPFETLHCASSFDNVSAPSVSATQRDVCYPTVSFSPPENPSREIPSTVGVAVEEQPTCLLSAVATATSTVPSHAQVENSPSPCNLVTPSLHLAHQSDPSSLPPYSPSPPEQFARVDAIASQHSSSLPPLPFGASSLQRPSSVLRCDSYVECELAKLNGLMPSMRLLDSPPQSISAYLPSRDDKKVEGVIPLLKSFSLDGSMELITAEHILHFARIISSSLHYENDKRLQQEITAVKNIPLPQGVALLGGVELPSQFGLSEHNSAACLPPAERKTLLSDSPTIVTDQGLFAEYVHPVMYSESVNNLYDAANKDRTQSTVFVAEPWKSDRVDETVTQLPQQGNDKSDSPTSPVSLLLSSSTCLPQSDHSPSQLNFAPSSTSASFSTSACSSSASSSASTCVSSACIGSTPLSDELSFSASSSVPSPPTISAPSISTVKSMESDKPGLAAGSSLPVRPPLPSAQLDEGDSSGSIGFRSDKNISATAAIASYKSFKSIAAGPPLPKVPRSSCKPAVSFEETTNAAVEDRYKSSESAVAENVAKSLKRSWLAVLTSTKSAGMEQSKDAFVAQKAVNEKSVNGVATQETEELELKEEKRKQELAKLMLEAAGESLLDELLLAADACQLLPLAKLDMKPDLKEWSKLILQSHKQGKLVLKRLSKCKYHHEYKNYNRCGLKNHANLCYLNAVMQALNPVSFFFQLVRKMQFQSARPFWNSMKNVAALFYPSITDVHVVDDGVAGDVHKGKSICPISRSVDLCPPMTELLDSWVTDSNAASAIGFQQDASEFLTYILNGLHDECKWQPMCMKKSETDEFVEVGKKNKKVEQRSHGQDEDSLIKRIFGGMMRTTYKDKQGHKTSDDFEPFLIFNPHLSKTDQSIEDVINSYCTEQKLEGNGNVRSQQIVFEQLPVVLVVALKRFMFDRKTAQAVKITESVEFNNTINIHPEWCSGSIPPEHLDYELFAVVCHHGTSADGGHYNAAVKYREDDWYLYDDNLCAAKTFNEVKAMEGCYMFLYINRNIEITMDPSCPPQECRSVIRAAGSA